MQRALFLPFNLSANHEIISIDKPLVDNVVIDGEQEVNLTSNTSNRVLDLQIFNSAARA